MEIKKLLYNSFNQCFFEARFLYKTNEAKNTTSESDLEGVSVLEDENKTIKKLEEFDFQNITKAVSDPIFGDQYAFDYYGKGQIALNFNDTNNSFSLLVSHEKLPEAIINSVSGNHLLINNTNLNSALNEVRNSILRANQLPEIKIKTKEKDAVVAETAHGTNEIKVGVESRKERQKLRREIKVNIVEIDDPRLISSKTEAHKKNLLTQNEFLDKVQDNNFKSEYDKWTTDIAREDTQVNVDHWDPSSTEGVQIMANEFAQLGIKVNSPYYKTFFAILHNAAEHMPEEKKTLLVNPYNNIKEIRAIAANKKFIGGEALASALVHLQMIRTHLLKRKEQQKDFFKMQEALGKSNPVEKASEFIGANLNKFRDAIKKRDYATAGLYVFGIYAMYKSYKKISETSGGKNLGKWLTYGAAAYAGVTFAKHAGYDLLEMAGLKENDAELKGTSLEYAKPLLASFDETRKLAEGEDAIDYEILGKMGNVELKRYQDIYYETHKYGQDFIPPSLFPEIFPNFVAMSYLDKGIGADGLGRDEGLNNKNLTSKEKAYVRTGHQLAKILFGMEKLYDNTLRTDPNPENPYRMVSFKEAVQGETNDGQRIRSLGKVRHFFAAVSDYSNVRSRPGILGTVDRFKVEESLRNEVYKGSEFKNINLLIHNNAPNGHYHGTLKGFPVTFVDDGDSWKFYLKNDYRGKSPGSNYTRLKKDGSSNTNAKLSVDKVDSRVSYLLRSVKKSTGDTTPSKLEYSGGKWRTKVTLPSSSKFDIESKDVEAFVIITNDGKGVIVKNDDIGVILRLDEEIAKMNPIAYAILPRLINQTEFKPLSYLYETGKIKHLEEVDPNDPNNTEIKVKIGDSGLEMHLKFNSTTKKYEFVNPNDEKELLENNIFKNELVESIKEQQEIKAVQEKWNKLIDNTPEAYFSHFFKSVPKWFDRGVRMEDFTGSVPKNYVKSLIASQIDYSIYKFLNKYDGSTKLTDINTTINLTIANVSSELDRKATNFSSLNTKNYKEGVEFTRDAFELNVFNSIYDAGIESKNYKGWYKRFSDEIFFRYGAGAANTEKAQKSGDILRTFSYYTSAVDNPDMDGDKDPELFKLSQLYLNYVVGKIYEKINQGELDGRMVPDPDDFGFWKIKKFKDWKNNVVIGPEWVPNAGPTLKWNTGDNYIYFSDWVKLDKTKRNEFSDNVILDEAEVQGPINTTFVTNSPDTDDIRDKIKEIHTVNKRTELQTEFSNKMAEKLFEFEEAVGSEKLKSGNWADFKARYILKDNETYIPSRNGNNVTLSYEFETDLLSYEVKDLENDLNTINNSGTTVTRAIQNELINQRIKSIFEAKIKNNPDLLKDDSVKAWITGAWSDLMLKIFGP